MSPSSLRQAIEAYWSILQGENKALMGTNNNQHRNVIDKGELIGHHLLEGILVKVAFLSLKMNEQEYERVGGSVCSWFKDSVGFDKRIVKRVLGKLFVGNRFEDIVKIEGEISQYIHNLIAPKSQLIAHECSLEIEGQFQEERVFSSQILPDVDQIRDQRPPYFEELSQLGQHQSSISESSLAIGSFASCATISFISTAEIQEMDEFKIEDTQPHIILETQDPITSYFQYEVIHPCTDLTEFCHQMRLPLPKYESTKVGQKKVSVKCEVTISAGEWTRFVDRQYSAQFQAYNIRNARLEASRKVLSLIYRRNLDVWRKYRAIKERKGLET